MLLGKRLQAVAAFVKVNESFADIGTDHAYLPIYLVQENRIERCIACDVHRGPYEAAKKTVAKYKMADKIEVRLGDGLKSLKPGEVEASAIAGMGGMTIVEILSGRPEVTARLSSLVLQPQNAAREVRCWLQEHGWAVVEETLVLEDGRLYEILLARQGMTVQMQEEILYDIGPCLWQKRHPLLKQHIENLRDKTMRVLLGMQSSRTAAESERYRQIKRKLQNLEEKLKCL